MFRRFLAVAGGAALALTLSTGPAHAGSLPTLFGVMNELAPMQYWVLDDASGPAFNSVEAAPPMATTGVGPRVTWHTASHPLGGFQPESVRLNANGVRSGQYLRSAPVPGELFKPGSVVIWFRVPKAQAWTQVLAVDNGAWSGTASGLMIDPGGHLVSEDATGFVDFRSKRVVADGKWHCAVWVDTYRPEPNPSGSTLYLDGAQATNSLVALWVPRLGVQGSRLLLGDAGAQEHKGIGRLAGNLSNVAIYDYPLNGDDIASMWVVGHFGSSGG